MRLPVNTGFALVYKTMKTFSVAKQKKDRALFMREQRTYVQ